MKMQVLEFVAIQRRDTGAWAIPGGMVDPGEKVGGTILSRSCLKPTNVINIFLIFKGERHCEEGVHGRSSRLHRSSQGHNLLQCFIKNL